MKEKDTQAIQKMLEAYSVFKQKIAELESRKNSIAKEISEKIEKSQVEEVLGKIKNM